MIVPIMYMVSLNIINFKFVFLYAYDLGVVLVWGIPV